MNIKRIGRALICLLLIFCLILNIAPPKAEATGAGAAALITGAAGVSVAAPLAVGAGLIALGVMASEVNPLVFENVVNDAVDSLAAAGNWVKDGTVELLQTIDSAGQKAYYVAGDMLEDLRSWIYTGTDNSPVVSSSAAFCGTEFKIPGKSLTYIFSAPVYLVCHYIHGPSSKYSTGLNYKYFAVSSESFYRTTSSSSSKTYSNDLGSYHVMTLASGSGGVITPVAGIHYVYYGQVDDITQSSYMTDLPLGLPSDYIVSTDYDLTLGSIPYAGAFTDGSSALEWAEEYARKALKVIEGGNDPDPDSQPPNDGKWFWPLALGLTVGVLGSMSQADEWSGQTPQEFNDYSTKTEFEILNRPEFDGWQGLEIAPATNPNPDPGTNPGTGGDSGSDSESTWFQKIIQGIEELPSKFESWITDCKTAIEELPSKFAEWFNNINSKLERLGERLQTIGESIVNGVSTLGEKIVTLGQIIVEGVENAISSLFTPSPDYFTNKVEALKAKHHNIDKFTQLGNDFKIFFTGLGSKPPIIWIDLGAATGAYLWGGRQIFLDLTWYADYKPKMDAILGAIIWLWLAWRVFLSVPGIINGASGVWGKYHRGGSRDDN